MTLLGTAGLCVLVFACLSYQIEKKAIVLSTTLVVVYAPVFHPSSRFTAKHVTIIGYAHLIGPNVATRILAVVNGH